jgi:hypothetical protein
MGLVGRGTRSVVIEAGGSALTVTVEETPMGNGAAAFQAVPRLDQTCLHLDGAAMDEFPLLNQQAISMSILKRLRET